MDIVEDHTDAAKAPGFFVSVRSETLQGGGRILRADKRFYFYSELDSTIELYIPDDLIDLPENQEILEALDGEGESVALELLNLNEYKLAQDRFSLLLDALEDRTIERPTIRSLFDGPVPNTISFEVKKELQVLAATILALKEWLVLHDVVTSEAPRKRWKGTKKDFALLVIDAYDTDQTKPQNEQEFKNLRQASMILFDRYDIDNWSAEKCYSYVRQIRDQGV